MTFFSAIKIILFMRGRTWKGGGERGGKRRQSGGEWREKEKRRRGRPPDSKNVGRVRAESFSGCIEELLLKKRKRGEEGGDRREEGEIFGKSEKIRRSPGKEEEKGEGLKEILGQKREEMREAREERKEMRRMLEEIDGRWGKGMEEIKRKVEDIGKEMSKMEDEKNGDGDRREEEGKEKEEYSNKRDEDREGGGGRSKGECSKFARRVGVEVELKEVGRIGGKDREGREMIWVRLGSKEGKKRVMEERKELRERRERIGDDLTWRERRIEWMVREEAEKERANGRRVREGYMKM
ncbi:hypothetical protein X777_09581 [Ooceraea biroi]|uniref:Uncharacterized protein n=1 Tax=Ooceraea biroi TaxID=2015173 RepID=A0A026W7C0_OOCBI|nr:hypothetical protein X777_09581 [Ooceraea biroi]